MDGEPAARVPETELVALVTAALVAAGTPGDLAAAVARASVDADLDGRPTHGVIRIPAFVAKIRAGGMDPAARPTIVHSVGGSVALDGHDGFGQVALFEAAGLAVDRARRFGVGAVTVRNITNPGMLAAYGRAIADAGCIGILGCNAAPAMAPHGTRVPFLGTNPLCVAIPVAGEGPFLLDMATTATSKAAVARAARHGEAIPEGWATDRDGNPTTDPAVALDGLLLPAAGPKGAGLALVIDILAGLLAGAAAGPEVRGFQDAGRSGTGGFVLALDPTAWSAAGDGDLAERVAHHLRRIRALPPLEPGRTPRTPGERAAAAREHNRREGIRVGHTLLASLGALADHREP